MGASCAGTASSQAYDAKHLIVTEQTAAETKTSTPPSAIFCPLHLTGMEFLLPKCLVFHKYIYIGGKKSLCRVRKNLVIQNAIQLELPLNLELILDVLAKPGSWRTVTSHGYKGCHEWCCLVTQLLAMYTQFLHTSKIIHDQYSLQLES